MGNEEDEPIHPIEFKGDEKAGDNENDNANANNENADNGNDDDNDDGVPSEVDEEGTTKKRSTMKKDRVKNKNKTNDPTETETITIVEDGKILNGEDEKTIVRPSALLLRTSLLRVQER